jgi:hypothetical protein
MKYRTNRNSLRQPSVGSEGNFSGKYRVSSPGHGKKTARPRFDDIYMKTFGSGSGPLNQSNSFSKEYTKIHSPQLQEGFKNF